MPQFPFSFWKTPNPPSNLIATLISGTEIDLTWTDNSSDETSFRIERDSGSGFVEIASVSAGVTSYNDTTLAAPQSFSYRVRARSGFSNSAYSNTASKNTGQYYLPQIGPFANLAPQLISGLSDLTFNSGTWAFVTTSRTSPLICNNLVISGGTNVAADPSGGAGYGVWIWCNTVTIGAGQAITSTWQGAPYPDGSSIDGTDGIYDGVQFYTGGNGGSGGSGAGGGGAEGSGGGGANGGAGSRAGNNGSAGTAGDADGIAGIAGRGTGASDWSGSPWTPLTGGNNGGGYTPTAPGFGAAGSAGDVNTAGASGGSGAGGGSVTIVCRNNANDAAGHQGILCGGGNAGQDSGDPNILEGEGGGGGIIEYFCVAYSGCLVPYNSGGVGTYATKNGTAGQYLLHELDKSGTVILANHTNENDTWNNL